MWKPSEYCDLTCTWHCNHDPHFSSSFNCIQNSDTDNWNAKQNELESENVLKYTPVVCSRNSESEVLEITSRCKSHHGVSLIGFSIVSEAKTVEVYSDFDGYLLTVKGHKLQLNEEVVTDGVEIPVLYCFVTKLDKPADSIILKFLGISEKQNVKMYRLHFYLNQTDTKSCTTPNGPGMIDMEKVKGYLHSMGDSAPKNGTKLLHAVEDFQLSQMSGFGGLQALSSGNGNSFGLLANLLSVANRPLNDMDTKNNHTDSASLEQSSSQGSGKLSAMLKSMSESQNGCQGDSSGQGQMFAMLQNICGKVGKMRVNEHIPPEDMKEDQQDYVDTERLEISEGKHGDIEEIHSSKQTGIDIKLMQAMIEQTVSQMFETSEQKLKECFYTSLNAMESRLSQKLDYLMELLQNGNKQPSTNSDEPH